MTILSIRMIIFSYQENCSKFNFILQFFQFLGFCTYYFIVGNGALIPGNPNIGVVEWGGKYFAFSSAEFAKEFGKNPLQ